MRTPEYIKLAKRLDEALKKSPVRACLTDQIVIRKTVLRRGATGSIKASKNYRWIFFPDGERRRGIGMNLLDLYYLQIPTLNHYLD